jgi:Zn-dependent metalloprotease
MSSCVAVAVFAGVTLATAEAAENLEPMGQRISTLQSQGARLAYKQDRKTVGFIGTSKSAPITVSGTSPGAAAEHNAFVYAREYGPLFGVSDPANQLSVKKTGRNGAGGGMVRYQQHHRGVPVIGGELIVNTDVNAAMLSMIGRATNVPATLVTEPAISAAQARATALAAVAEWHKVPQASLHAETPELSIYDPRLISPDTMPASLVWRTEVTSTARAPIREFVLVDAQRGGIALHFNQIHTAKNRETYNFTGTLPGALVCNEASGDTCSRGSNAEADRAHLYAGHTYDFYRTYHGRDSIDGAGLTLVSTVNYVHPVDCSPSNASWTGQQMVYCTNMVTDDIVAHELTHAVTQYTSGLYYYYQSGAINESLSDIWGEFVDMTNGSGLDGAANDWMIGEGSALGVIRNMANPPARNDPDRTQSPLYYTGTLDSGGVHTNSGVNNKAAYLMTAGGTFNGYTIAGLGIEKVAKIYYEVQTTQLTSGSDYLDLYNGLIQACHNLVGTSGISAADCQQVRNAAEAVQMNLPIAFNPEAALCPVGQNPVNAFYDGFEGTLANWTLTTTNPNNGWMRTTGYATSGDQSLFVFDGDNLPGGADVSATISVNVPAGQPYLHFRHAYDFELATANGTTTYYDGGVVEWSTDGGANWYTTVIDSGQNYTGYVSSDGTAPSPLALRWVFVGTSNGYVSTRMNLGTLAGRNVRFRWRAGFNGSTVPWQLGWILDDVRVYTCAAGNLAPSANAGTNQTVNYSQPVWLSGSGLDRDGTIVSYAWTQIAGTPVTLARANTATPTFRAPGVGGDLGFRLTVTDNAGATASDIVGVRVNYPPFVNAGDDQTVNVGDTVTLNAVTSDQDTFDPISARTWTQTAGTPVALRNANTDTATFIAPQTAGTLTFQFAVTDSHNGSGSDTVNVVVRAPDTGGGTGGGSSGGSTGGDSGSSGGGGGCALNPRAGFDPTLPVLGLIAGLAMLRRRRGAVASVADPEYLVPHTGEKVMLKNNHALAPIAVLIAVLLTACGGGGGGGGGGGDGGNTGGGGGNPNSANDARNLMHYCRTDADRQAAAECNIASGQGDVVTTGTLNTNRTVVRLADARSWQQQDWQRQGVRLKRAGFSAGLQTATASDSNRLVTCTDGRDPHVDIANPSYLTAAQLKYRISRAGATGQPVPPTLSEYDELRLVVRASRSFNAGEVFVRIPNWNCTVNDPVADDEYGPVSIRVGARLLLPALSAGQDTEVYLHINREIPSYNDRLDFYVSAAACDAGCVAGLTISLIDAEAVSDHVTRATRASGVELTLERAAMRDPCVGRANCSIAVTHDDTEAVRSWLQHWGDRASATAPALLTVPSGIYPLSSVRTFSPRGSDWTIGHDSPLRIYSHTELRCDSRDTAVFRTVPNRATGKPSMFRAYGTGDTTFDPQTSPQNITVSGCGFDLNGWNGYDFATPLILSGTDVRDANGQVQYLMASHMKVIGNRFTDSAPPGREGCDHYSDLKKCATRQRQYVLAYLANDVEIRDNLLEHGGRIKAAGPGERISITNNTLDFVNDNGITIVDSGGPPNLQLMTRDVVIANNTIRDAMSTGIFFGMDGTPLDPTRSVLENIRIENNRIEGHFGGGIKLVTPWLTSNVAITGNTVVRSGQPTVPNPVWNDLPCGESPLVGLLLQPGGSDIPTFIGSTVAAVVRDIRIESNTITMNRQLSQGSALCTTLSADRTYGSVVGMMLDGPRADMSVDGMHGLTVQNNAVACTGCGERGPSAGNDGIWLRTGRFTNAWVEGNRVSNFQRALRVDDNYYFSLPPALCIPSSTEYQQDPRTPAEKFVLCEDWKRTHPEPELRMTASSFLRNVLSGSLDTVGGQIYLSATHYGVGSTVPDYLDIQMTDNQMSNGAGYGIFYACRDVLVPGDVFSTTTLAPLGSVYTNNALGDTNLSGLSCPNSGYR